MGANIVNGNDIGMIELARGAGFLLESSEAIFILGKRGRQDLDRDVALEPHIPCTIDLAHRARAEEALDQVLADRRAVLEPLAARPWRGDQSWTVCERTFVRHGPHRSSETRPLPCGFNGMPVRGGSLGPL